MKELQGVEEMWLADLRITNVRKSGAGLSFGKIFGGSSLGDLKKLRLADIHWALPKPGAALPSALPFTLNRLSIVWNSNSISHPVIPNLSS